MQQWWLKFRQMENRVLDFFVKHNILIIIAIATVLALVVRLKFRQFESGDFIVFLQPWFDELRAGGGLPAIANYTGDYNMPYVTILALLTYLPFSALTSIKLVSIVFDFVLAISAAYLVYTVTTKNRKMLAAGTYMVMLFLPQFFLNSACWGQCEAIYASFCILALTFLIKEKYWLSFILLGVACAFKLQFIFILPIFVIVYLMKRKFSILNFFIIPVVNLILCIPSLLMGKPLIDCLTVYLGQTQTYAEHTGLNFLNLYTIFDTGAEYWNLVGTILAMMICVGTVFWIINHKVELNNQKILLLATWFVVIITFFLPGMHERYLYVGEILAIIYYIVYRKQGVLALVISVAAWITYAHYLFGLEYNPLPYALVLVAVVAKYTRDVFAELGASR